MKFLRKIFYYINYFKNLFFQNPKLILKELVEDWKKDQNALRVKKNHHLIWICSLPKSGSTLVEEIISFYPYVKLDRSLNRLYSSGLKKNSHNISYEMFDSAPKNKLSFIKTHTPYNEKFIQLSKNFNCKTIITFRDLRDVMISRFYHILSDPKHDQFYKISKMSEKEGFIYSFKNKDYNEDGSFSNNGGHSPVDYYYYWIKNWKNKIKSTGGLELWYEDFILNKKVFLSKIINFLNEECEENTIQNIEFYLERNKKRKIGKSFANLIHDKSKNVSTFRSGKIENWKTFFDEEITEQFNNSLPGPLESVIKKL